MAEPASSLRCLGDIRHLVSGRVRELCVLQTERQRSRRGELRMGLVLGEAGLGKTRLAAELLPHSNDFAVGLTAHSGLFRSIPPIGRWAAALGWRAGGPDNGGVCHACGSGLGGLPLLGRHAQHTHDADSCAQTLRHHVVEWIPGLLAKASADRPIVMVVDDAHHTHDAVWEMLLHLAQEFPASRVFVLATARPAELARNWRALEVLHALEQDAQLHQVQLAPFSQHDVGELAAATFRRDRVPAALLDWLMAHAQGNPRFTIGLLEALAERGADMQAPSVRRVPEKLARWIRTELARLDAPALNLVELLAVIGSPVDPDDLARISRTPSEDVALTLERLVRFGTVAEQQRDQSLGYALAHPLTREVVYADIGGARRRVMHRRVAAALLEAGQREAATAHFDRAARAGDGQAIDALIEMAHRAAQQGLCSQTWTTVSTLQNLLPTGDRRWLVVFGGLCGHSRWGVVDRTEHYVTEIAALRRMQLLLAGVDDLQLRADMRLWLAGLFAYGAGDLDSGQQQCRQALALCQHTGRTTAARSAAIELAKMRGFAGDLRGEQRAAQQLLSEAERAGDQRGIVEALGALGHALGWQGRFEAAEEVLMRSVELSTGAAHASWMSQSLALLASFDACRGHLASARARWAQAAASSPRHDPVIGRCGAFIELLTGDLGMAQAHARQVEGHDPAVRSRLPIRLACRAAMAAAERGAVLEARRQLHVLSGTERTSLGILEPLSWWADGAVARVEGRLTAASAAFQRAAECYSAMNAQALRGFVLVDLAEVAVTAGDLDTSEHAAVWARDTACRTDAPLQETIHLLVVSWEQIGRGHHEKAAQAALRAVDEFSSRGYTLLAARARIAYATALCQLDSNRGWPDRSRAAAAIVEAAAAFDACGATVRAGHARSMFLQLGPDGQCATPAVRGPDALTRRERQVAELAAGGYTAGQIATRLHIGVRTVETHLARSYRKLGVTGKQELVRRAADFGFHRGP